MRELLESIVSRSIDELNEPDARQEIPPAKGVSEHTRNCLAEQRIYQLTIKILKQTIGEGNFYLISEGFPKVGNPEAETIFIQDPVDGTAYFARQRLLSNPFVSTVVGSVTHGRTYNDVTASSIGIHGHREIISAEKDAGAKSMRGKLRPGINEGIHIPVVASDFYFPQNAQARLALRNLTNPEWEKFECLNTGSVAHMMTMVASGDLSAFFNLVGPTPYELVAGYRIITEAGGHVLSADDGKELGEREIDLSMKRVPIIAAYDEKTAKDIYEKVKTFV